MFSPEQRTDVKFDALCQRASLSRLIERASQARYFDGAEGEILGETARRSGRIFDSSRPVVPWEMLAIRADTVTSAASGGYLVPSSAVLPAADALRPTTVVVQLGANVVPVSTANYSLPRQTGVATAAWMTAETTVIAEKEQTFGSVGLSPHTVGAYTEVSRQLLLQSNADEVIRRDLLAVVGRAIDLAALHGTGMLGQPLGITNMPGIGSFSGTSLAIGGVVDAFTSLGDGLGEGGGVAANRTVAGTLRKRVETGGTKTIWDGNVVNGTVAGFPARSSTAVASGNLIIGSWDKLTVALWNGGIEVMTNPFGDPLTAPNNFAKGIVGIRCFASLDVGISFPSAFTVSTAVT
jgi:HK97 family phage major capsid protein